MERPASIASEKEGRSPVDESALGYTDERVLPRWKRVLGGVGSSNEGTQRGMHSRHLIMIALGGTIGTGIFLSVGASIALAGPGATLLSYALVGVFVYAEVIPLGEMSAMYPVPGAFADYATRFVSPSLGFAIGWNYWWGWVISIPVELTAASVILNYWTDALKAWEWALIIIAPIYALQLIHVRVYGEMEYWFSMIKVLIIVIFIIVGLIYDWGGVIGHPGPGLANFREGQAFSGFSEFAQTFLFAFYAFGGVELVALAAGESKKPHKSVPSAIKATFFRIMFFYVFTVLVIGLCINRDDPIMSYGSNASASPITAVFVRAGFGAAAHVVNAVLLTAVLSATNSCFYGSSRMLLSLARSGKAPAFLGWVNRRGVPVPALTASLGVSFLSFLTAIWSADVVFTWLVNLGSISTLLVWMTIGWISVRFRAAWKAQGRDLADLPYKQPLFPILPIGVLVFGTIMFVAEGYGAVKTEPFAARNVVATYVGLVVYALLYVGYTIYQRIAMPGVPHFVPLLEADLDSDAVWGPGEGRAIKQREAQERKEIMVHGSWRERMATFFD